MTCPPMPPDALPWTIRHAVGRPTAEALWAGVFHAGQLSGGLIVGLAFVALMLAAVVVGMALDKLTRSRNQ